MAVLPRTMAPCSLRRGIRRQPRAKPGRHAGNLDVVLHADRNAVEEPLGCAGQPASLRRFGGSQRARGVEMAIRVDDRIEALDARQRRLHGLDGGELLGAIERNKLAGGEEGGVGR
jgi:hypothetical protein